MTNVVVKRNSIVEPTAPARPMAVNAMTATATPCATLHQCGRTAAPPAGQDATVILQFLPLRG